ncbi:helix-turn-helix transcriptional regulator [Aureimonas sp. SK2]|uniref:helix-turn-helix domain-containing protein n=1 Tax=Aureimonas sp. SK2 TaxID=3015992 RepID=UPI002444F0AB|nr:helix-turn-helix transcriptional regulator [Aureimonas sp. SK2]
MPKKNAFPAGEIDVVIGRNIRSIRKDRHLATQDMANLLGKTAQQCQLYELGHTRVSAHALKRIANLLRVPATAFFAGLDDPVTNEPIPVYGSKELFLKLDMALLDAETASLIEKLAKKFA